MLYYKKQISETAILGIWRLEEPKETFSGLLLNVDWICDIMNLKSESRIIEKLATRVLVKELLGKEKFICNSPSGCPSISDGSYNISISHTKGFVAVLLDEAHSVAIDIEQMAEKVKRVRERLISTKEFIDHEQEIVHLLLHWSAKETLFKILDVEGVDFLKHLFIKPFTPQPEGVCVAHEYRTEKNSSFNINYRVEEEFVLTYIVGK